MKLNHFGLFKSPSVLSVCVLLTGCGASFDPTSSPVASEVGEIRGVIHGGQQPVVGAHVYVLAAGTQANAGPGLTASSSNLSSSLLTTGSGTDPIGTYVLTAADGSFALTGKYTCTSGTQVYLYARGGNPGAGTNSSAAFLAALGQCPDSQTLASSVPYVWMNEVTTIATAYALAGYATDATHISSDTAAAGNAASAQAATGIANAFANVNELVDISTGTARSANTTGKAVVPQNILNALANILASCVNSSDAAPGTCPTLFVNAKSGGSTGTAATDTATAAINIAHNPASNVSTLTGLVASTGAPFQPTLPVTPVPNDLTVALTYNNVTYKYETSGITPMSLAVDASGNVWVKDPYHVAELDRKGTGIYSYYPGYFLDYDYSPITSISIDASGNAWIGNSNTSSPGIAKIDTTHSVQHITPQFLFEKLASPSAVMMATNGYLWYTESASNAVDIATISGNYFLSRNKYYGSIGLSSPISIAALPSGDVWVLNSNSSFNRFDSYGGPWSAAAILLGTTSSAQGMAVDHSGNVWIAAGNQVAVLDSSGAPLNFSPLSGGGLSQASGVALDGAGNAWLGGSPTISEFSQTGAAIAPHGYTSVGAVQSTGIAVDGSGNVWSLNADGSLSELIGAAVPVVTPIAFGLKSGVLAARP